MIVFGKYDRDETVGGGHVNGCVKGVRYLLSWCVPFSSE